MAGQVEVQIKAPLLYTPHGNLFRVHKEWKPLQHFKQLTNGGDSRSAEVSGGTAVTTVVPPPYWISHRSIGDEYVGRGFLDRILTDLG